MLMIVGGLGILALIILWAAVGVARWRTPAGVTPDDITWVQNYSLRRYRILDRLSNDHDLQWLRGQQGFRPGMDSKLRSTRLRAIRRFLTELEGDHSRIYAVAQHLIASSPIDRSDIALRLWQERTNFALRLHLIRGRLFLYQMGFPRLAVTEGLSSVQSLLDAIRPLQAVSMASAA